MFTIFLKVFIGLTSLLSKHIVYGSFANNKTMELHNHVLANYNPVIRPGIGNNSPLTLNLTYHLTSLNDLDEVQAEMNSVGYLTVSWIEDRISWNPVDYAGVTSILLPKIKVWTPTLMLANPTVKFSDLNADRTLIRILYNGLVFWNLGEVFHTRCYPNIYRYPYDDQECYIAVTPWGYLETEIQLNIPLPYVKTPFYKDNGEWVLKRSRTLSHVANGISVGYFYLTFSRRPEFVVVNVILPILFLSLLNCLVYVIPTESGERISYSITVLLSFAVFMTLINDNIPKTSAPLPLLCYFMISVFAGSALIIVSTITNVKVYYADPKKPVPLAFKWLVRFVLKKKCIFNRNLPPKTTAVDILKLDPEEITHKSEKKSWRNTPNAEKNILKFESKPNTESFTEDSVEWKQVANVLDKVSLILFVSYFTIAMVVQLLYICLPD